MSTAAANTLLVVDDDKDMREALESALTDEGFTVLLAATAQECIAVALARQPRAVLLDDGLPDQRGIDALVELRAKGFRGPVVMLSGSADLVALRTSGADHVFHKPVDFDHLCGVLRVLIP